MLLHVLDVSHPHFRHLCESVEDVLKELESFDKKTIVVLNKIDKLTDVDILNGFQKSFDCAVSISAKTRENIDGLPDKISEMLSERIVEIDVEVPIGRMDLVNLAHEEGEVLSVKYYAKVINIRAIVPKNIAGRFYK